jgi:thioredoxin-related protein
MIMTDEKDIPWIEDLEEAKRTAKRSGKPILLFFHYKYCTGCINTFNRVLNRDEVAEAIKEGFVPVLLETLERPHEVEAYNVEWTPTFIVADESGLENERWEGFLPEGPFLAHLDMGRGRIALKKKDYVAAEELFDKVEKNFRNTDQAPKAAYYAGVARYRASEDPSKLTDAYERLRGIYPDSIWTTKASVWSKENIEGLRAA